MARALAIGARWGQETLCFPVAPMGLEERASTRYPGQVLWHGQVPCSRAKVTQPIFRNPLIYIANIAVLALFHTRNRGVAERLWDLSVDMTGGDPGI